MTLKQKQALLAYLGFYGGQLDGVWGQQSQKYNYKILITHTMLRIV